MENTANELKFTWPVGLDPKSVVIDNESTGLDPRKNSLIEIAAVKADGSVFELAFRPRPGAEIDDAALDVNGWSRPRLDALHCGYYEAVDMFFDWLAQPLKGERPIRRWVAAGQNPANVEYQFLRQAWADLGRAERYFPLTHRVIDLHDRACVYAHLLGEEMPEGGWASDRLCALLGIPGEATPHRAINGVRWEVAAFDKIGRFFEKLGLTLKEEKEVDRGES